MVGSSHEGSASLNMTVRRFTSRFRRVLKAGFISALMHNPIALNVFFRFFILCRLTWRKSSIVAFLEAMRAFSSEPWCQKFLHQGSDIKTFRAQVWPNLRVNYQWYFAGMVSRPARSSISMRLSSAFTSASAGAKSSRMSSSLK